MLKHPIPVAIMGFCVTMSMLILFFLKGAHAISLSPTAENVVGVSLILGVVMFLAGAGKIVKKSSFF